MGGRKANNWSGSRQPVVVSQQQPLLVPWRKGRTHPPLAAQLLQLSAQLASSNTRLHTPCVFIEAHISQWQDIHLGSCSSLKPLWYRADHFVIRTKLQSSYLVRMSKFKPRRPAPPPPNMPAETQLRGYFERWEIPLATNFTSLKINSCV